MLGLAMLYEKILENAKIFKDLLSNQATLKHLGSVGHSKTVLVRHREGTEDPRSYGVGSFGVKRRTPIRSVINPI